MEVPPERLDISVMKRSSRELVIRQPKKSDVRSKPSIRERQ